ncbi:MAG: hypothetical protein QM632_05565 [Micrococcaceae bacterium]
MNTKKYKVIDYTKDADAIIESFASQKYQIDVPILRMKKNLIKGVDANNKYVYSESAIKNREKEIEQNQSFYDSIDKAPFDRTFFNLVYGKSGRWNPEVTD